MKGAQISTLPPQLDITAPETEVQVEYDKTRNVLYVHIEGFTCLRICQITEGVKFKFI